MAKYQVIFILFVCLWSSSKSISFSTNIQSKNNLRALQAIGGSVDNSDTLDLILKLLEAILERLDSRNDKNSDHDKDKANAISEIKREMNSLKDRMTDLVGNLDRITYKIEELSGIKEEIFVIKEEMQDNRDYTTKKYVELKKEVGQSGKESETLYTRWGRTTCPGNNSDAVYTGFAAGSYYQHSGAAASMLCLPKDPDWVGGKYSDKKTSESDFLYGTEYQVDMTFGRSYVQHDAPCVVCNVKGRSSTIMVPGKTRCHAGWTFEYSGYLMSGRYSHAAATNYYCVDKNPEVVPGSIANKNGYLLYLVEARCGSLKCPPYVEGREFTCVVCTK